MQAEEKSYYTPEEYLEFEIQSDERHEYFDGEVVCITGATPNHNRIVGNFYAALNFALKRQPYDAFVTDQRLWIPSKRIYTYPDVMVVAQPLEYAESRRDTLINPLVIAEVLSISTQNYDRSEKFVAYRSIPTLQEYILIDQYSMHIEHFCKSDRKHWTLTEYDDPEECLSLQSIAFQIELVDIYDKVEFEIAQ